jgi:hypothetical protein
MAARERGRESAVRWLREIVARLAIVGAVLEGDPMLQNAANAADKLLDAAALLLTEVENGKA